MDNISQVRNYRITTGGPMADVICPHGFAIDIINRYDYALGADMQTARIGTADLEEWLGDNARHLWEYCQFGHR